jgi:hypothetical protein
MSAAASQRPRHAVLAMHSSPPVGGGRGGARKERGGAKSERACSSVRRMDDCEPSTTRGSRVGGNSTRGLAFAAMHAARIPTKVLGVYDETHTRTRWDGPRAFGCGGR